MPIPIGIDLHVPDALEALIRPRQRQHMLRRIYTLLGERWGSDMLPKHFTAAGGREYGYAPRQGEPGRTGEKKTFWASYTGRKQRQFGHTDPLVFTGESRRRARQYRVRATSKGATVTVPAPALNFTRGRINMAAEVRTVTAAEKQTLTAYAHRTLARTLRELTGRKTKRLT